MNNKLPKFVFWMVVAVTSAGAAFTFWVLAQRYMDRTIERERYDARADTLEEMVGECSCPKPELTPCSPDELHRLEIYLYGVHNHLEKSYNRVEDAMDEIGKARRAVEELAETPEERELREYGEAVKADTARRRERRNLRAAENAIKATKWMRDNP